MKLLQFALIGNAGFSLLTGLILSIWSKTVADVFQAATHIPFLVIGLGLLFFAYTILIEVKPQRRVKVFSIIVQDLIWVVASVVILLSRPLKILPVGYHWITAIAVVVLGFAILQAIGWRKRMKMEAS